MVMLEISPGDGAVAGGDDGGAVGVPAAGAAPASASALHAVPGELLPLRLQHHRASSRPYLQHWEEILPLSITDLKFYRNYITHE